MLIIGAGGYAKELLELVEAEYGYNSIAFFDNTSDNQLRFLFDSYEIIKSLNAAQSFFKTSNSFEFVLGVGGPYNREKLHHLITSIGGKVKTLISKKATVGSYSVSIGQGTTIMQGSIITNNISIGRGCLININSTISHDSVIGDFVEISPSANILGGCIIGNFTIIGSNATILPNVKIGDNCIIGAGSVVLKDIPKNSVVVGVPGRVINQNLK